MLVTFTNEEIYNIGNQLSEVFGEEDNKHFFSAKINFLIQKNKKVLLNAAVDIEKVRLSILNKYGSQQEDGQLFIPPEKIQDANKELIDLLQIKQELNIYKIDFEDLEGIEFTAAQMKALMFMINDPEEKEDEYYDIENI